MRDWRKRLKDLEEEYHLTPLYVDWLSSKILDLMACPHLKKSYPWTDLYLYYSPEDESIDADFSDEEGKRDSFTVSFYQDMTMEVFFDDGDRS
jgi:hypothetical protein